MLEKWINIILMTGLSLSCFLNSTKLLIITIGLGIFSSKKAQNMHAHIYEQINKRLQSKIAFK